MNNLQKICNYKNCTKTSRLFYNDNIYCGPHFKNIYNISNNVKISTIKDISNYKLYDLEFHKTKNFMKFVFINTIIQNNTGNNNLHVIKKIGNGEFGSVYLIEDLKTKKKYALKIVFYDDKNIKKSEKMIKILSNEILCYKRLWKLNCTNVSNKTFDDNSYHNKEKSYSYIILEYMDKTLSNLILENKLQLNDIKKIITDIINVIQLLHKYNIIYNDFKPDNVMIDFENNTKLIDFGLCSNYLIKLKNNDNESYKYKHVEKLQVGLNGNERFSSVDNQRGFKTSRISDIESIGYLFIYIYDPSFSIFHNNKNREEFILRKSNLLKNENFKKLPLCIQNYFIEIHKYKYETKPNYNKLIKIINKN